MGLIAGISLEKAQLYEKYRLPYAGEAVADLCQAITAHDVVADVGAVPAKSLDTTAVSRYPLRP